MLEPENRRLTVPSSTIEYMVAVQGEVGQACVHKISNLKVGQRKLTNKHSTVNMVLDIEADQCSFWLRNAIKWPNSHEIL